VAEVKNPVRLTGLQRRTLRGLGHHLKPVIQVGKAGVTEGLINATRDALERHELIKVTVLAEAPLDRKEAPEVLAEATGAHVAQILGRTSLLYRRRFDDPTIALPGPLEIAKRPPGAEETPKR
jgi:RNA-binding protein